MNSFETDLKKLEEIVRKLETGEAKLAESMSLFEEGVRLTGSLTKMLDEAQAKITLLTADEVQNNE